MILLFAGEVVLLRTALNASNEYSAIVGLMEPDEVSTLPYATYEGYLSKEFNRFFFGAISDCQSKRIALVAVSFLDPCFNLFDLYVHPL